MRRHFLLDFPFLVLYGAAGLLYAQQVLAGPARGVGTALAVGAAAFDALENMLHMRLLSAGELPQSDAPFRRAAICASLKYLALVLYLVIICVAT